MFLHAALLRVFLHATSDLGHRLAANDTNKRILHIGGYRIVKYVPFSAPLSGLGSRSTIRAASFRKGLNK